MQKLTWPDPVKGQTLTVNAPKVPEPLTAQELKDFDRNYRSAVEQKGDVGYGYGQIDADTVQEGDIYSGQPVDTDYRYYISLYGYFDQKMVPKKPNGSQFPGVGSKEDRMSYERQSMEEMREDVRTYVQRPTDHSTLPMDQRFMSRVVAYDLPIGYCWHSWDRASLAELRHQADWLESDDYYWSGKLDIPPMPSIIKRDIEPNVAERKAEAIQVLNAQSNLNSLA